MTQNSHAAARLTIVEDDGSRPVAVISSDYYKFPELFIDVFVVGDAYEQAMFAQLFVKARCRKAESIEKADLVVFSGGDDVNPALYGETAHPQTAFDSERDKIDMAVYEECYTHGVPMLGICRGAQFGHVMNGGKLFQHVDRHFGDHPIYCQNEKRMLERVSSVHHQMCIEHPDMDVLAFCGRSTERWFNEKTSELNTKKDIEAFFYRDSCFIGIQGHPEYSGYDDFAGWTFRTLDHLVNCNTDLALKDGVRRIKPDILEQRTSKIAKLLN